jgi:hypothetical protein
MDFSLSNQEPVVAAVLEQVIRPPRQGGLTELDQQVRPASQVGQTGSGSKDQKMLRPERPVGNEGKDHVKHNGKKPKLTFAELLAKYQKDNEAKGANRSNDAKYSRLPPRHNYGIGIGKERVFIQRQHILLLSHQCRLHMFHIPLVIILIHHGGGLIHGHILLHISNHITLSMQLQGDHHMQGSHMLKVTVLSIKIDPVFRTRKRFSSEFTK